MKLTPQILALYLGQKIRVSPPLRDETRDYTIKSVKDDGKIWIGKEKVTYSFAHTPSERDALILRPLSSMTEQEAIEVCKLVEPLPFSSPTKHKWVCKKGGTEKEPVWSVSSKSNYYSFCIDLTQFDVDVYQDEGLSTGMGQSKAFLYLISQGFDLFGLIQSGAAIDSTTIQETANS